MKNILTILILLSATLSNKVNAQLDTLNYLKQFEINKINYIGKPVSYLLNNMIQIQPKTIWSMPSFKSRRYVYASEFRFVNKENSLRQNNIFLAIDWQDPIPMSEVEHYEKKNHFIFTDEERSYYGTKIIKNIIVHR